MGPFCLPVSGKLAGGGGELCCCLFFTGSSAPSPPGVHQAQAGGGAEAAGDPAAAAPAGTGPAAGEAGGGGWGSCLPAGQGPLPPLPSPRSLPSLSLQEYKRKQLEEQRQSERLQRQLQQEHAYLKSLQQQQQQQPKPLYHHGRSSAAAPEKPPWAREVLPRGPFPEAPPLAWRGGGEGCRGAVGQLSVAPRWKSGSTRRAPPRWQPRPSWESPGKTLPPSPVPSRGPSPHPHRRPPCSAPSSPRRGSTRWAPLSPCHLLCFHLLLLPTPPSQLLHPIGCFSHWLPSALSPPAGGRSRRLRTPVSPGEERLASPIEGPRETHTPGPRVGVVGEPRPGLGCQALGSRDPSVTPTHGLSLHRATWPTASRSNHTLPPSLAPSRCRTSPARTWLPSLSMTPPPPPRPLLAGA